ncbi:MAG: hypothetical protein J2P45_12875 [Candidatus Dormibacteraeota bacterium]|nr:hypothetical protein [Candidatus Dormibacteraeota bacterium]
MVVLVGMVIYLAVRPTYPPRNAVASAAYVSESAVAVGDREKIVVKVAVRGSGWDGVFTVKVAHHVLVSTSDVIECSSQTQSHLVKAENWGPITETDTCWGPPQAPGTGNRAQELIELSEGWYSESPHTAIVDLSLPSPTFYST